ncbi:hypothetical protein [Streptomyces sp. NPDC005336]|uniref:hypothetical protein n=1 Tax=Streptomyces sp. NPDC005336 TaxID=3157035 RepID=UPI0033BCB9C0
MAATDGLGRLSDGLGRLSGGPGRDGSAVVDHAPHPRRRVCDATHEGRGSPPGPS